MGLTVDVKSNGGVLLTRYDKNQQIFLSRESFFKLVAIKNVIEQSFQTKTEERRPLGNNVFAAVNIFNEAMFLHIRIWWNDQPTKQGVSLPYGEWGHLYNFLHFDDEASIGTKVLQEMLSEAVGKFIETDCEGCRKNWPSQNDHACIIDSTNTARRCIDRVFDRLNVLEFITRLAKAGQSNNVIIKKPQDTFHFIKLIKEDELKMTTLSSYHDS